MLQFTKIFDNIAILYKEYFTIKYSLYTLVEIVGDILAYKYMKLSECKNGEILSENLYDLEGSILVSKNSTINSYIAEKLEEYKVDKIPVYISKEELSKRQIRNFRGLYKESVITLKTIMNNLAIGKVVVPEKIREISDALYEYIDKGGISIEYIFEIKTKDKYTYNHSINVALYALLIAEWVGCSEEEKKNIIKAGLLHDIGKSRIPSEILNKKGKLTKEEFDIVKTHTTIGYTMAKDILSIDENVRQAILSHHERIDGSGYPQGLKGDEINNYAKILAIADVYDALISKRVYKEKSTPFQAVEELKRVGAYSFDANILKVFFDNIVNYYLGSKVKVSDGHIGEIVFIPPNNITCPVVKLGNTYVDLAKEEDLKILEMVG